MTTWGYLKSQSFKQWELAQLGRHVDCKHVAGSIPLLQNFFRATSIISTLIDWNRWLLRNQYRIEQIFCLFWTKKLHNNSQLGNVWLGFRNVILDKAHALVIDQNWDHILRKAATLWAEIKTLTQKTWFSTFNCDATCRPLESGLSVSLEKYVEINQAGFRLESNLFRMVSRLKKQN